MKVAVICDVLGEETNGATHAGMNFIRNLQMKGHDVTIVCPDEDKKGLKGYYVCPKRNFGPLNNFIKKVGVTIAKTDEKVLYREFGINAELLIDHAWGRESCLMSDIKQYRGKTKSISSSQILPCNYKFEDAKLVMMEMIQNGCYELFRRGYVTQHLHLVIGYGDNRNDNAKGTCVITTLK